MPFCPRPGREQIVLDRRSGLTPRSLVKTGQIDVITTEILWTAIHVVEHPSEGILTADLRPFVPAISNEKPSSLRCDSTARASFSEG